MIYEIHLYVPKTGKLTGTMLDWLFKYGQRDDQPEDHWPVKPINTRALARLLLRFDANLTPVAGPGNDVELHHVDERLGLLFYVHDRGLIIFFPYMRYGVHSRIVLGICYTYIRYLYEIAGFWSYDPQLDVLSFGDDFRSIEETVWLMEQTMPRLLPSNR